MSRILIVCALVATLLVACSGPGDRYVSLAQCMTEKGVVEYGTFWCPNCAKQKKELGKAAMEYVTYVECDPRGDNEQSALCLEKDITKYPTWELSDGSMHIGVKSPAELAELAGCPLPEEV